MVNAVKITPYGSDKPMSRRGGGRGTHSGILSHGKDSCELSIRENKLRKNPSAGHASLNGIVLCRGVGSLSEV